jgi:hypothetical protein
VHELPSDRDGEGSVKTTTAPAVGASGPSSSTSGVPEAQPLDLDAFCRWLQSELALSSTPDPADHLSEDLQLDHVRLLTLVTELDRLLLGEGIVDVSVYDNLVTVRELHLYYLYRSQVPKEGGSLRSPLSGSGGSAGQK